MERRRRPLALDIEARLGFVPRAVAIMGKWEPTMAARRCLQEVAARAAAALALSEALYPEGPGLFLLCAEGLLRGQPRPGCQLAAEILLSLGASPDRIRCWPASNRTAVEVDSLHRMRLSVGGGGLVLVTSPYHAPRTRRVAARILPEVRDLAVLGFTSSLVEAALRELSPERHRLLSATMEAGRRRGLAHLPVAATEGLGFLVGELPFVERWLADWLRGRVIRKQNGIYTP